MKLVAVKRVSLGVLAAGLVAVLTTKTAYADEWSKSYNLSGKPDLRIETSDANIRVTTWDQNTIEAKVITSRYKIGEGGIRVDEHQTGDSVEIRSAHHPHVTSTWAGAITASTLLSRCRARAGSTCARAMARLISPD